MCRVRSPKSIAGAVGLALGNTPYGNSDRTNAEAHPPAPMRESRTRNCLRARVGWIAKLDRYVR
ncbi:MAG: hypothetical protein EWV82_12580 [Microcystis aeruginosa Ma_AC_P_19900807_S299]|nr:MAG: hypothetical protein EWV82_12580 [Microcystis aeruginosa Ma_AC_P_19900807_S299]